MKSITDKAPTNLVNLEPQNIDPAKNIIPLAPADAPEAPC